MNTNFDPSKRRNGIAGPEKSVFTQIFTAAIGLLLLVGAFMFSLVFFAIIAVAGALIWGYFLWKTRAIRAHMRQQMEQQARGQGPVSTPPASAPASGEIIEGEAVRVVEERNRLPE